MPPTDPDPLPSEETALLTEFGRACKAAARVVALYPATHPAIRSALDRVTDAGQRLRIGGRATLTVLPDTLLLEGRGVPKPDASIVDLAALLHSHLVGELSLQGELTPTTWHAFLSILAKSPEAVRADGGVARAWMASGGGPIEIRQIDYTEVLRERSGGLSAEWDRLIENYLEGELSDLDEEAMSALFDIAGDPERFQDFTERLVAQSTEGGRRGKKEVVLRVLQALADYVASHHPDQLDRILNQIAGTVPLLTPELVVTMITTGAPLREGVDRPGIDMPGEVRARITDQDITEFVAQSVARDRGATERLAQAFQTLVPEASHRGGVLDLVQKALSHLPFGKQPEFPDLWKSAAELLQSYSDERFVSDEYGRELSTARTHAIEVERVSDDPPARVGTWLATVSDQEIRRLDQQLIVDLLKIEKRVDAWRKMLDTAVDYINQLVLTGHVTLAQEILDTIVSFSDEGDYAAAARGGLDRLREGPIMKHVVIFVRQAHEEEVAQVSAFCRTLGPTVIRPLVEALTAEHSSVTIKRLREILLSFGPAGREYANELRASANPAVRRTAIDLLRSFGGADALPDLAALLSDAEPGVQRDALRAIVHIGTNEAYAALHEALKTGTDRTRDAIMHVLASSRDERAAPLFAYILEHTDHRGGLEAVYLAAVDALGKVGGDAESIAALKKTLFRGDWWAPMRTGRIRRAAARALMALNSELATRTIEEAAHDAPWGVRRAVRAAIEGSTSKTSEWSEH